MLSSLIDLYPSRINNLLISELKYSILVSKKFNERQKDELQAKFKELEDKYVDNLKKSMEKAKAIDRRFRGIKFDELYKTLPSTDFNEIEVIPGAMDLIERKPKSSIRKMPEEGDLIDKHNYLDLLFRLLHEDAINDLREGVIMMTNIGS